MLTFTVPAGVTITESNLWTPTQSGIAQSGNVVTLTGSSGLVGLSAQNSFSVQFGFVATLVALSNVTLDGIPVSQG